MTRMCRTPGKAFRPAAFCSNPVREDLTFSHRLHTLSPFCRIAINSDFVVVADDDANRGILHQIPNTSILGWSATTQGYVVAQKGADMHR